MKKRLFLAMPLLLLGSSALAQTVSESEALEKAINFVKAQGPQKARGAETSVQLALAHKASAQDETYYYVFNNMADGGFVIIGGDEVADEVLGYSENGSFDYENLPANFRWWLSTYEQSIGRSIRAQRACPDVAANAPKKARASYPNISHLLQTKWNQDMPYNAMIPGNTPETPNTLQYATGCVATAVAQIMKYHQWPEHGWSTHSYKWGGTTYQADFGAATYDWAAMHNTYNGYTGSTADQAVAQLMYHVGVSIDMQYGIMDDGGSGASTYDAAQSLRKYFGYKEAQYHEREEFPNDETFEYYVYNELSNNRPVLYSGAHGQSGHAFVCDGYDNGRFHINWGWGGYCDGTYLLTPTATEQALDPNGSGIGGAGTGATYTESQAIVIGVQPDRSYEGGLFVTRIGLPNEGNFTVGEDFEVEFDLENSTSQPLTISSPWLWFFPEEGGNSLGYLYLDQPVTIGAHEKATIKFDKTRGYTNCLNTKATLQARFDDYESSSSNVLQTFEHFMLNLCDPLNFSYTLTDAAWGTLCLPYSAEVPTGLTAYEVTDVNDNGTLVRTEATKLEMNKAYLVSGTPGTYNFHGPDTPEGVYQNGVLWGVTKKTGDYAPKDSYVLQNKPTEGVGFYKVNTPYSYRAKKYSAYLKTSAAAHARILIDNETGIQAVELDETQTATMLNVMGQRTNASKGLMIVNGKLNFVK